MSVLLNRRFDCDDEELRLNAEPQADVFQTKTTFPCHFCVAVIKFCFVTSPPVAP